MSSGSAFAMLHNKIKNAAELRGLEPDEILRELHQDAERQLAREYDERQAQKYGVTAGYDPEESFPQEIRLIARALAYRAATVDDLDSLETLLNKAYKAEIEGSEAFRCDSQPVNKDTISYYLSEPTYQWLVIEAPAGQTTEPEGTILGACCYSTDGHYKIKEQKLMKLGSIRFFAVLPRYHGLCIGQRLLTKVHDLFRKHGCQLSLANIPSARLSLIDWIQRRGYEPMNEISYPFVALGHTPLESDSLNQTVSASKDSDKITLVQCLFALVDEKAMVSTTPSNADTSPDNTNTNSAPLPRSALSTNVKSSTLENATDDFSAQPKVASIFRPPSNPNSTATTNNPSSNITTNSNNDSNHQKQQRAARLAEKMKRLTMDSGGLLAPAEDTATDAVTPGTAKLQDELNRVD